MYVFAECDFTIIQILSALTSGRTALPFVKDLALSLVSGLPRTQRHLVFDFGSLHFVLCQLWNEGCRGHGGVWLHPCSWDVDSCIIDDAVGAGTISDIFLTSFFLTHKILRLLGQLRDYILHKPPYRYARRSLGPEPPIKPTNSSFLVLKRLSCFLFLNN